MIELLIAIQFKLFLYLGLATCLAMLVWGGGPERALAGFWLTRFLTEAIYHWVFGYRMIYVRVDWYHASIDTVATVVTLLIALKANRMYALWIATFQLFVLSGHLARAKIEGVTQLDYALMLDIPQWLMLLTMMIGFKCHLDRRRKYGPYRDWRWQARPGGEPGNGAQAHLESTRAGE